MLTEVPVVLVHKDNIASYMPAIIYAIKSATYVAMDLEMTGLGNRKDLMSKCIEERYSHMSMVAKTRSVVSLGLSCFKRDPAATVDASQPAPSSASAAFTVQTYNIVLLCTEEYTVEPLSLRFLVQHGFDFNQQYAKGVPYHRGNDKSDVSVDEYRVRDIVGEILRVCVPVVLHNAMVDLVYLYQNFYCQLPAKLDTFLADLSEVFAGGIVDTKTIADYLIRWPASYLEYVFRRSQTENRDRARDGKGHVMVSFCPYGTGNADVEYRQCRLPDEAEVANLENDQQKFCENYAAHGNCRLYDRCPDSHDIDVILAAEAKLDAQNAHKRKTKRKRRRKGAKEMTSSPRSDDVTAVPMETDEKRLATADDSDNPQYALNPTDQHDSHERSTLDEEHSSSPLPSTPEPLNPTATAAEPLNPTATAAEPLNPTATAAEPLNPTATAAESETNMDSKTEPPTRCNGHRAGFDAFMTGFILATFLHRQGLLQHNTINFHHLPNMNSIYMSGKDIPLLVRKGAFAKVSKNHKEKIQRLTNTGEKC